MKMMKLFPKKMNQKGMTLVEVLVAMVIITVVAVPTLQMFARSSRTNLNSRLRSRATLVGEAVMESLKAYDMEALCKQFEAGTFQGVTSDGSTSMSVTALGIPSGDPFRPDKELDQSATGYELRANNVVSKGKGYDVYYDVLVEATPTVRRTDVLKMNSPNAYSDAIISLDMDFNTRLASEINAQAKNAFVTNTGKALDSITDVEIKNFERTICVDVDDDGSVQTVKLKVDCTAEATITYKYSATPGGPATLTGTYLVPSSDMDMSITLPDDASTDTELLVYDNTSTIAGVEIEGKKCKLNQIFLYYCPAYEDLFGNGAADIIRLEGDLTELYNPGVSSQPEAEGYLPLRLNVAKQLNTSITDIDLDIQETNYNISVESSVAGGGTVELISNLDQNLSTIDSVIAPYGCAGFSGVYTYEEGVQGTVELLYDVVVHVYKAGTTEEVALFTGTMNE